MNVSRIHDLHDRRGRLHDARTRTPLFPKLVRQVQQTGRESLPVNVTERVHPLLRIATMSRASSSITELAYIPSPSLASFTPAELPVYESLCEPPLNRFDTLPRPKRQRPSLFSLFTSREVDNNGNTRPTYPPLSPSPSLARPTPPEAYHAYTFTSGRYLPPTPPPSPSIPIPSITRTHSTAVFSSLPATPPLPLSPISLSRASSSPRFRTSMPPVARTPRHATTASGSPATRNIGAPRERTASLPIPIPSQETKIGRSTRSPSPGPEFKRIFPPQHLPPLREDTASLLSPTQNCTSSSSLALQPSRAASLRSLEAFESPFKFKQSSSACAVCGVQGPDFPRCSRCGDAWCSRKCREIAATKAQNNRTGTSTEAGPGGRGGLRGHGCRAISMPGGSNFSTRAGVGSSSSNAESDANPRGRMEGLS